MDLGFSVNYAPDQTRLDRLNDQELAGLFGPVKFRLARTREQIDRDISVGRVGRELFPAVDPGGGVWCWGWKCWWRIGFIKE